MTDKPPANEETAVDEDEINGCSKPKRPLSAYNFFFQSERRKIIASMSDPLLAEEGSKSQSSQGKCDYSNVVKLIAKRWNDRDIDPEEMRRFEELARRESNRYRTQRAEYRKAKKKQQVFLIKKEEQRERDEQQLLDAPKKNTKRKKPPPSNATASSQPSGSFSSDEDCMMLQSRNRALKQELAKISSASETGGDYLMGWDPTDTERDQMRLSPNAVELASVPFGQEFHRLNQQSIAALYHKLGDECVDFIITSFL